MRDCVSRIAEAVHAKIMAGDVKPEPAESPCRECPAQGCCEMVRCREKNKAKTLRALKKGIEKYGIPHEIIIDALAK